MTWLEKIKSGMELISSGCSDVKGWSACNMCPFEDVCEAVTVSENTRFSCSDPFTPSDGFKNIYNSEGENE